MAKQNLISFLVFGACLMALLGLYVLIRERIAYRGRIRSRVKFPKQTPIPTESELGDIRQTRSLAPDGYFAISITSLNKLILQSGSSWGLSGLLWFALLSAAAAYLAAYLAAADLAVRLLLPLCCGFALPIAVLRAMRAGRQAKFEEQLPDAIETVVRGLKAGHAVSVAIASVGKNMPDPAGAEFRLTAAEMTYGLDLESAMTNLYARVGQPDLGLVALAVSIQSKTGGNLSEVLANLSRVIRERFKLRRKARALSSEGRFSALILSSMPVLLFCVIYILSPSYYSEALRDSTSRSILGGAVLWMLLGNYIMYRMVRIRV
jgi:tight adherence protein B